MSETQFVQMLLEAAGDVVTDERDRDLAASAGRHVLGRGGWRPHETGDGFLCLDRNGLQMWVTAEFELGLRIMARVDGRQWVLYTRHPIDSLGHALDFLGAERLIDPRFCPMGRTVLLDHAEALDRTAARIIDDPTRSYLAHGLVTAADSARRFVGSAQAVLAR